MSFLYAPRGQLLTLDVGFVLAQTMGCQEEQCLRIVCSTIEWTKDMDQDIHSRAVQQAILGNFTPGERNTSAILIARASMNEEFGTNFDYGYFVGRTKKLLKRYQVFNWMTQLSGVYYDSNTNFVHCGKDSWDMICRLFDLSMHYAQKINISQGPPTEHQFYHKTST
ncbi:hypothetical protein DH2020_008349 [Rehmannia glutinosa]|uniref:Myb/SANT-like domain-containing protein n=1 Tax=Rehmannia glutinosa TaxID=99300 RepID=A0ABR0U1V1_REHGL